MKKHKKLTINILKQTTGCTNRQELGSVIRPLLRSKPGLTRLHNQYLLCVYANAMREPPETEIAPWVSHQGKANLLPKPATGDAHERRLKKEVMSLPARDRRRMKEIPDVSRHVSTTAFVPINRRRKKRGAANIPSYV